MNQQTTLKTEPNRVASWDWARITEDLNRQGYAQISGVLTEAECNALAAGYDDDGAFRKTVPMKRYRFGLGEYKYWAYPLPDIMQELRQTLYPYLAPIMNDWFGKLGITPLLPLDFSEFQELCHTNGQKLPTPLILKYGKGGFNTLHQDLYGDVYFPVQTVINLSKPGEDFEGGTFVMTEQVPRAQSKAIVLNPKQGDMVIFTTNFRPVKGSRGYYRARMRHGVSEVERGERITTGIIFHDAVS